MERAVATVNGTSQKAMLIFNVATESIDKEAREGIGIAGVEMDDLTTIRRPDLRRVKQKFAHSRSLHNRNWGASKSHDDRRQNI